MSNYRIVYCGYIFRNFTKLKLYIFKLLIIIFVIVMLTIGIGTFKGTKEVTRRKRFHELNLPLNIKFVLIWTRSDKPPINYFSDQKYFIEKNCTWSNCYVTDDIDFFGGTISKFHAVLFNGNKLNHVEFDVVTQRKRTPYQKFVYVNSEPWIYHPIRNKYFNGFFNWTMTYRLDSDIPYPYVIVRNEKGDIVGPKKDVALEDVQGEVDEETLNKIKSKNKMAAWFVSNCHTPSRRERYVVKLQRALRFYGYDVDIYGKCGKFMCSRIRESDCDLMLERDYFFYLAFENSIVEDYISEKVLRALRYNTVPVVRGKVNYSWYLPPGSYLDAFAHPPWKIAMLMKDIIQNPPAYQSFFRWKKKYTYPMHDPMTSEDICAFCAALNNKEMYEKYSVVEDIESWWNTKKRHD